jgi:hypothetical protein
LHPGPAVHSIKQNVSDIDYAYTLRHCTGALLRVHWTMVQALN